MGCAVVHPYPYFWKDDTQLILIEMSLQGYHKLGLQRIQYVKIVGLRVNELTYDIVALLEAGGRCCLQEWGGKSQEAISQSELRLGSSSVTGSCN